MLRRLLGLECWFDRLDERRRVLAGLGVLGFVGASCLYILGIGSSVVVSRMALPLVAEPAPVVVRVPARAPAAPVVVQPSLPTPAPAQAVGPAPTPAVIAGGELIEPPSVREVTLVPRPPQVVWQPEPLKPRVGATPQTTPAPVASPRPGGLLGPAAPVASPRPAAPAGPGASPVPLAPAAPQPGPNGPVVAPTATVPAKPANGPTPTSVPTARPQTTTVPPTATPRPAGPTPTPARR